MSSQPKMIDRGTGASPPWSNTRETGTSPIHFDSSIQFIISDDFYDCSTTINHGKRSTKETIVMNDMINKQLILPFPSPVTNESSNVSSILSSINSTKLLPLMSIGLNDGYGINSYPNSSTPINIINKENNNNHFWPVDHSNQYNITNHKKRTQNISSYKIHHHRHQHQFYCRECTRRPYTTTSVNRQHKSNHLNNNHCRCRSCHDCCL